MKWIPNVLTGAAALLLSLGAQAQEEPIILVENGSARVPYTASPFTFNHSPTSFSRT